jgi:hypothetical protein
MKDSIHIVTKEQLNRLYIAWGVRCKTPRSHTVSPSRILFPIDPQYTFHSAVITKLVQKSTYGKALYEVVLKHERICPDCGSLLGDQTITWGDGKKNTHGEWYDYCEICDFTGNRIYPKEARLTKSDSYEIKEE